MPDARRALCCPAVATGRDSGDRARYTLLADAISRSLATTAAIGTKGLVVDSAGEEARGFCARNGFASIPGLDRISALNPKDKFETHFANCFSNFSIVFLNCYTIGCHRRIRMKGTA